MLIFEEVNNLNDLEFSIYKYIVNHPQEVLNMKIRDLAKETHVSTPSILRFCKKVNCDGYSELKTKIKILLNTNVNYEFDPRKMAAIDFFKNKILVN
ncbi:MAG: MurR/RpiR family transcriptional regulator [Erysipelotrichaceae bacterium]|nr:MurR/RpiR family transcriptional regulator [Erysipelotrichaceae bacterium]